jgi:hypothetical protein
MADSAARQQIALLEHLVHSTDENELRAAAANPNMTEDLAMALLKRRDLPASVLQELAKNTEVLKLRPVLMAMICHPRTPRFISLPASRTLHTFELLSVALQPAVPSDVKIGIEQSIMDRLENMSLGERISLAKRGSTRIAEALLRDPELIVIELALVNSHLTEACVVRTLMIDEGVDERFVQLVANHPKWSLRTDVRAALLRNPKTPMGVALNIVHALPADIARDALLNSNLPTSVKAYLMNEIQHRLRD